jgi:hypothetical protein
MLKRSLDIPDEYRVQPKRPKALADALGWKQATSVYAGGAPYFYVRDNDSEPLAKTPLSICVSFNRATDLWLVEDRRKAQQAYATPRDEPREKARLEGESRVFLAASLAFAGEQANLLFEDAIDPSGSVFSRVLKASPLKTAKERGCGPTDSFNWTLLDLLQERDVFVRNGRRCHSDGAYVEVVYSRLHFALLELAPRYSSEEWRGWIEGELFPTNGAIAPMLVAAEACRLFGFDDILTRWKSR